MTDIVLGAVVFIHLLWIAFLVLGLPLLVYFNMPRTRIVHLAALAVTILMQATSMVCPLTYVEEYLRMGGGTEAYPGRFMLELIRNFIYVGPDSLRIVGYFTIFYFLLTTASFLIWPISRRKRMHN